MVCIRQRDGKDVEYRMGTGVAGAEEQIEQKLAIPWTCLRQVRLRPGRDLLFYAMKFWSCSWPVTVWEAVYCKRLVRQPPNTQRPLPGKLANPSSAVTLKEIRSLFGRTVAFLLEQTQIV
jgi:hypothetical protein